MIEINYNHLYEKQVQEVKRITELIRNLPNVSQKVQPVDLQQVKSEIQNSQTSDQNLS